MAKEVKKNEISIFKPKEYLLQKSKSFDDAINQIRITPSKEKEIKKKVLKGIIRDVALGTFPIGKFIQKVFEWNKLTDEEIKEEKRNVLLAMHLSQTKENKDSITQLKDFLTNPSGNTIFNKILRIIDDSPPDLELLKYLSATLTKIIETKDFESLFEKHKYALSRIEMLSVQALTILCDYEEWSEFDIGGTTGTMSVFGKIQSDWVKPFVKSYVKIKAISDPDKINRISLSVRELKNAELVDAKSIKKRGDNRLIIRVSPTAGGNEIITYIEDAE